MRPVASGCLMVGSTVQVRVREQYEPLVRVLPVVQVQIRGSAFCVSCMMRVFVPRSNYVRVLVLVRNAMVAVLDASTG